MNNQNTLLTCALDLFSLRGYDAVSVQEVVEAAGVTKPTLYHYFSSKRGLLNALIKKEGNLLIKEVQTASNYQGDLVSTLENIIRVYFTFAQRFPIWYRMHLSMYFSPPASETNQAIRPYTNIQKEVIERIFIEAANDHGNIRGRHARYAAGFLGAINAMIGLFLNDELDLTEERVFQTAHQFMHGIFS